MAEINFIKITNNNLLGYNNLFELYQNSFPIEERRELKDLNYLIQNEKQMCFNSIEIENHLVGFIILWNFEDFIYIEHFAIFPEERCKGFGTEILEAIKANFKKTIVFEVEPENDLVSIIRINFYRRNLFEVIDKSYRQPSYHNKIDSYPMWIMSNKFDLTEITILNFIQIIKKNVYQSV